MSHPVENFCIVWPDWYQLRRRVINLARCGESIIARVIKASRAAGRSIIARSGAPRCGKSIIAHSVIKASRRRATGESIIERWPLARWGPGQSYRAGPKWFTGKTYRQAAKCATGKRAEVSGFFQNAYYSNYSRWIAAHEAFLIL